MFRFLLIGGGLVGVLLLVLILVTLFSDRDKKPKEPKPPKAKETKTKNNQSSLFKADTILDSIEDGVMMVGMDKIVHSFNRGANKITGWPTAEAIGLDYHSVLKLVDDKGAEYQDDQRPLSKVFLTKAPVRDNQATLISRSGKHIALHISASPLFDDNGEMTGAVAVFRDVSEERGEERQRAEFISTASHEMRTPVAAIEGYLALAMN